jgi:hypothetical protein
MDQGTVLVETRELGALGKTVVVLAVLAVVGSLSVGSFGSLLMTLAILCIGYRSLRNIQKPRCIVYGSAEQLRWTIGQKTTDVRFSDLKKVVSSFDRDDRPRTEFVLREGGRVALGHECHDHAPVIAFVRRHFSGTISDDRH